MTSYAFANTLLTSGKLTEEDHEKLIKLIEQDINGTPEGKNGRILKLAAHGAVPIVTGIHIPARRNTEAVAEVPGTAELLDSTLLYAPELELMNSLSLMRKGFRDAIEGSAAIKRRIWRLPGYETCHPSSLLSLDVIKGFLAWPRSSDGRPDGIIVRFLLGDMPESAKRGKTFHATQLGRPPVKHADFDSALFIVNGDPCFGQSAQLKEDYDLRREEGVTLDDLMDMVDMVLIMESLSEKGQATLPDWLRATLRTEQTTRIHCDSLAWICSPGRFC